MPNVWQPSASMRLNNVSNGNITQQRVNAVLTSMSLI
jgi:hypothetical protein